MSFPTVTYASAHEVHWRVDGSLTIESTYAFIAGSLAFAAEHGYRDIDGHRLYLDGLVLLQSAMDKEAIKADEIATDRIAERVMDHSQETT